MTTTAKNRVKAGPIQGKCNGQSVLFLLLKDLPIVVVLTHLITKGNDGNPMQIHKIQKIINET